MTLPWHQTTFAGAGGPARRRVPTVSRADAEAAIVEQIVGYLAPLG